MDTVEKIGCEHAVQIADIVAKYDRNPRYLIPILHDIQDEVGYVAQGCMETVADELGIPVAQVHGTASFFTLFYMEPHGKHIVRMCNSQPCHLEGAAKIRKALVEELGVEPGSTTDDNLFTFEEVSCMGLCGVAPAIMIGDDVYGNMTPEKVSEVVSRYKEDK